VSVAASNPAGFPQWTVRRASWVLGALLLPSVLAPPVYVLARYPHLSLGGGVLLGLAAAALGGLQLRHSQAGLRGGGRPRGWPASLLATVLLAYVPTWWFSWDWAGTQWFVLASAALLLGRRVALPIGAVAGANAAVFAHGSWREGANLGETVFWTVYWLALVVMGSLALYAAARLVRVAQEVHATRLGLAAAAVGRERLRVSRDLHDLLGQSLSAVSLKADLAVRWLPSDPAAARAEAQELTGLARSALRDVRAVTHDEHVMSLGNEVDAATALLDAAGVETDVEVDVDLAGLPSPTDVVLAWAVREGTTNLLRHSDAQACRIRASRRDGVVRLEVVNDGARGPVGSGTGIAGVTQRAQAVSGSVTAGSQAGGRFRLVVEVPDPPRTSA
jgi:two-component system, NarL family, sensor histidine kinase DesK